MNSLLVQVQVKEVPFPKHLGATIYVATPDDFRTLPVDCTQAVLSLCVCVVLLPFSFLHAQQQRQRAAAYELHLPFYIRKRRRRRH